MGAAGGRGTGAGGGSSWPLARGLGDAGLTSAPRPWPPSKKRGEAGWESGPEGVSTGKRRGRGGGHRVTLPGQKLRVPGPGQPLPRGLTHFPNLPPAPRKWSGKCKRKRRGNPSLGQRARRDTRGRNWGGDGGGRVPSKTDLASAPACTGTALQAPNFKRGGASLNSPPHAAHPPHTPPVPKVGRGERRGEAGLFVELPRQPPPGLRAPHWRSAPTLAPLPRQPHPQQETCRVGDPTPGPFAPAPTQPPASLQNRPGWLFTGFGKSRFGTNGFGTAHPG